MNPIAVWILFGLGIVFLIVGALLMIYGSVQKKAHADGAEAGGWDKILEGAAHLVAAFGKYLGPNVSTRVGLILVFLGLVLVFGPYYLPIRA